MKKIKNKKTSLLFRQTALPFINLSDGRSLPQLIIPLWGGLGSIFPIKYFKVKYVNLIKIFKKTNKAFWAIKKYQKLSLLLFLITGIVLLTTIALFANSIPSIHETIVLATTVQPEHFTELYFENHTNLPKDAEADKSYSFKFTTHNLEYKQTTYLYEVYIDNNDNKTQIDKSQFTLNHDQYKTITETYQIPTLLRRAKIIVNLINKDQQINFWIDNEKK